jgi:hypothetical protein
MPLKERTVLLQQEEREEEVPTRRVTAEEIFRLAEVEDPLTPFLVQAETEEVEVEARREAEDLPSTEEERVVEEVEAHLEAEDLPSKARTNSGTSISRSIVNSICGSYLSGMAMAKLPLSTFARSLSSSGSLLRWRRISVPLPL